MEFQVVYQSKYHFFKLFIAQFGGIFFNFTNALHLKQIENVEAKK